MDLIVYVLIPTEPLNQLTFPGIIFGQEILLIIISSFIHNSILVTITYIQLSAGFWSSEEPLYLERWSEVTDQSSDG